MLKHLLNYAPSKLIPGLINFIGLMIYARLFTQAEYGRYAYVLAIISLVQSIFFPWIRMSSIRFYQRYKKEGKNEEFEGFILFIFLIVSLILSLVWILIVNIFVEKYKSLYLLGLIVILAQALFEQLMAFTRARLQSKLFAKNTILLSLLKISVVLILVLFFNLNENALFIGIIIAHIIPLFFLFKKHFKVYFMYFYINKDILNLTLKYGLPLTFSFLLATLISTTDKIFIEYFLGSEDVGLYSIPFEFTSFSLTNIFMVFSMTFFPLVVKELEHSNISKLNYRINQYFEILLSITLPITIFMVMNAHFVTELFLGNEYNSTEAIIIIKMVSIATFLAGFKAYYFDFAFQLGSKTFAQVIPVMLAAIINIVFNIILIPKMGVLGAVISSIISYLIGIISSIAIGNRIFTMPIPKKNLIKIIAINLLLILLLSFLAKIQVSWLGFFFVTTCSAAVYILFMYVLNINNIRYLEIKKIYKQFKNNR